MVRGIARINCPGKFYQTRVELLLLTVSSAEPYRFAGGLLFPVAERHFPRSKRMEKTGLPTSQLLPFRTHSSVQHPCANVEHRISPSSRTARPVSWAINWEPNAVLSMSELDQIRTAERQKNHLWNESSKIWWEGALRNILPWNPV